MRGFFYPDNQDYYLDLDKKIVHNLDHSISKKNFGQLVKDLVQNNPDIAPQDRGRIISRLAQIFNF